MDDTRVRMFCTMCGAKTADGAKYCSRCGATIGSPAERKRKTKAWMPLLAGVVLLSLAGILWLFTNMDGGSHAGGDGAARWWQVLERLILIESVLMESLTG